MDAQTDASAATELLRELLDGLDRAAQAQLQAFDELNALRDRVERELMLRDAVPTRSAESASLASPRGR